MGVAESVGVDFAERMRMPSAASLFAIGIV